MTPLRPESLGLLQALWRPRDYARLAVVALLLGYPGLLGGPRSVAAEAVHLVILHTNDLHGQCQPLPAPWLNRARPPLAGGLLRLAERLAVERSGAAETLVVDAGDWFRGTPEGALGGGGEFARVLAALGLDAACVGNHELDHGVQHLEELLCATGLPAILANVQDPATGQGLVNTKPWVIVDRGGLRVAFVGLLTTVTPDITHADARSLRFEDPVQAWDTACRELEGRADLIIPLAHLAVDEARDLARKRPEIPLIISAHDHTRLEKGVLEGTTLIAQTGSRAAALGRVDLWVDLESRRVLWSEARLLDLVEPPAGLLSPALAAACQELTDRTSSEMDEVIGSLTIACERGKHRLSSVQGNWICDVMRRATGAQIGLQNKGGTRADLQAGTLTRRHFFELIPFDNTVVSMRLSGAALESILRRGIEDTRHRGLDVAGIQVHVRTRADGALAYSHSTIEGKRLDLEAEYSVATTSYLAGGEAGYVEFREGRERRETATLLRELLEEEARRSGPIDPPREARILVIPASLQGGPDAVQPAAAPTDPVAPVRTPSPTGAR